MNAAQAVALQEAIRRRNEGLSRYGGSQLTATIQDFARAQELAAAARNAAMEDESRFWHGAALHGAGRLEEALAAWMPALSRGPDAPLTRSRYMALTRLLLVIIDLPLPLPVIERTLEETANRLGGTDGAPGRRSRLLLARTRLSLARGRHSEASCLAREALERSRGEKEVYTASTYYRALVKTGLLVGELDLVERDIEEWDRVERTFLRTKRLLLTAARADLARLSGRPAEALALATPTETEVRRSEEVLYAQEARLACVRACLAAGRPGRARRPLAQAVKARHASTGDQPFEVWLHLADYYLAAARSSGTGDPELHPERASRVLDRASDVARRLDGLLRSNHRQASVEARRRTLRAIVG